MGLESQKTSPLSVKISLANSLSNVDLPEPFFPISPYFWADKLKFKSLKSILVFNMEYERLWAADIYLFYMTK